MYSIQQKIDFIKRAFGDGNVSSHDITVSCPKCDNKRKKKLSINFETDMFHCWVCSYKGHNLLSILKKYRPGKVQEYAEKILGKKIEFEDDFDKEVALELPHGFTFLGHRRKLEDPDIKAARFYLKRRNITNADIWKYKLGTYTAGRFRRRVFMPSFDDQGILNFYAARSIDNDSFIKYINAETPKKTIIFNHMNIDWTKELTIVEGPFDLMRCNMNSTAILGSSLPDDGVLFQEIVKNKTPILLALDSDMIHKTHKIAKLLSDYNITTRVLELGEFDDVGDMNKQQFEHARNNAQLWARNDRMSFMINNIKSGSIF